MVKDYAKRNSSFRAKSPKPKKYKKIIIFLIVFAGIAVLADRLFHHFAAPKKPIINSNAIKIVAQPVSNAESKVQFDFYTILTKEKVGATSSSNTFNPKSKYYLEIISVANNQEAMHLKDELAILGFDAFITIGKKDTSIVNIGPYYSVDVAKADQNKLHSKNINSILKKK